MAAIAGNSTVEKYLVAQRVSLGISKVDLRVGTTIEFYPNLRRFKINGITYGDCRDMDILLAQSERNPNNPWIIPYSKESEIELNRNSGAPRRVTATGVPSMKVVESDEDLVNEIDVRDTQVSKRKAEAEENKKEKIKSEKLEVVRSDEDVTDLRTSRKTALETIVANSAEREKLPIVVDDSLGNVSGVALNDGEVFKPKSAEAQKAALERAAARKKVVASSNKPPAESTPKQPEKVAAQSPSSYVEALDKAADESKAQDNEVKILREQLKSLQESNEKLLSLLSKVEDSQPTKRPRGRPRK